MPDFLDNKNSDEERPKDKGDKKEKIVWSEPDKEAKSSKGSAFSLLPFMKKKEPAGDKPGSLPDKDKISKSRREILRLIQHHESSKPAQKERGKNFLGALSEKLKDKPGDKEILVDYQKAFSREKEKKEQIGGIFNIKPAAESNKAAEVLGAPKASWLDGLIEFFRNRMKVRDDRETEIASKAEAPKRAEIKREAPAEKLKETKSGEKEIKEEKPVYREEPARHTLETNLIKGEIITFFDWRDKVVVSAAAFLIPVILVGAIYSGLIIYQKDSQAKNSEQVRKFNELEQTIAREEPGIKEASAFKEYLKTVSQVFAQHLYWTNFFNFLEENTIKEVYFLNFAGDTGGNYALDAVADSYGNIPEQVGIFRNNKKIEAAEAAGGEIAGGFDKAKQKVKFVLKFSILKNIFTE